MNYKLLAEVVDSWGDGLGLSIDTVVPGSAEEVEVCIFKRI